MSDASLELPATSTNGTNGHSTVTATEMALPTARHSNGHSTHNDSSSNDSNTLVLEQEPTGGENLPATDPAYGAPVSDTTKSWTPKSTARKAKKENGLKVTRRFHHSRARPL
jgi:hypothetical protein